LAESFAVQALDRKGRKVAAKVAKNPKEGTLYLHLPKPRQSMGRVLGEKGKTFPKTVVTGQMLSYYERVVIKGED
jgi:hypothetical protein